MPLFDNMMFTCLVGIDDLPHTAGAYIITTDASGGIKILGAYEGSDMHSSAENNPKRQCWEKNRKDTDPVAYYIEESDPKKRENICRGLIDRRYYDMVCNDPRTDDF